MAVLANAQSYQFPMVHLELFVTAQLVRLIVNQDTTRMAILELIVNFQRKIKCLHGQMHWPNV